MDLCFLIVGVFLRAQDCVVVQRESCVEIQVEEIEAESHLHDRHCGKWL